MQLPITTAFALGASLTLFACTEANTEETDPSSSSSTGGSSSSSTSTAGGGGSGGGSNSGGGQATGGGAPLNCAAGDDHLQISEVATQGSNAEFIEIHNPGTSAVDLSPYYLSDNSIYHGIAAGQAWDPSESLAGTDFLAQFPSGTTIEADGVLVIQASPATDFFDLYSRCPDLVLAQSAIDCDGDTIPAMLSPTNGSAGSQPGKMLSNEREMVMLFCWDGNSPVVEDVDYVTWGTEVQESSRVDKSGITGYADDTPRANQKAANFPAPNESIARCDATEDNETMSGGNGIAGHDETSEDMGASFVALTTPSPGEKNVCVGN